MQDVGREHGQLHHDRDLRSELLGLPGQPRTCTKPTDTLCLSVCNPSTGAGGHCHWVEHGISLSKLGARHCYARPARGRLPARRPREGGFCSTEWRTPQRRPAAASGRASMKTE
jgi:hypothetical protein